MTLIPKNVSPYNKSVCIDPRSSIDTSSKSQTQFNNAIDIPAIPNEVTTIKKTRIGFIIGMTINFSVVASKGAMVVVVLGSMRPLGFQSRNL